MAYVITFVFEDQEVVSFKRNYEFQEWAMADMHSMEEAYAEKGIKVLHCDFEPICKTAKTRKSA